MAKKNDKLTVILKTRVSQEMKQEVQRHVESIKERNEGFTEADFLRRAIRSHLDSLNPRKARAAKIKERDAEVFGDED